MFGPKVDYKGAARLLDETTPAWFQQVDLNTLRMESACDCVLGQVYGTYGAGARHLGLRTRRNRKILAAFASTADRNAWISLIQGRRARLQHAA